MTPILPERVARTAASAPGVITPSIGMRGNSRPRCRSATAETVLHATTTRPTWKCERKLTASPANLRTVASDLAPYGTRAVSPKYTIGHVGRSRRRWRTTVRPPMPESNTPSLTLSPVRHVERRQGVVVAADGLDRVSVDQNSDALDLRQVVRGRQDDRGQELPLASGPSAKPGDQGLVPVEVERAALRHVGVQELDPFGKRRRASLGRTRQKLAIDRAHPVGRTVLHDDVPIFGDQAVGAGRSVIERDASNPLEFRRERNEA